jgi:hypothetical protein
MKRRRLVITLTLIALTFTALSAGAPQFSEWSEPVNIGSPPNSPLPDFPGSISKDGLSLYIQRGVTVGEDLWVAQRDTDGPWGVPERLPDTVNSTYNDRAARVSPDGHWLLFASDRPGGLGGFDLWASWRGHVHDDFGWQPAINLGDGINSSDSDSGPTIFRDDDAGSVELYFTSGRPGGLGATDIYVSKSHMPGQFGSPELVPELSGPFRDEGPYIRRDGLEMFIQSNREDGVQFDCGSLGATAQSTCGQPRRK